MGVFGLTGIKNIQEGTVTIPAVDTVSTPAATITAVDTDKAFVLYNGNSGSSSQSGGASNHARVAITNATTVTATRGDNDGTVIVAFTVVEYY